MKAQGGPPPHHQPTKGGRKPHGGPPTTLACQAWGSLQGGPHLLQTCSAICGVVPPKRGGPPNQPTTKRGLPHKGGATHKTASPRSGGGLSPIRQALCFFTRVLSGKFRKVPEHFLGTLQKIPDACPKPVYGLMVYSETIFWYDGSLRNTSGFLSETFSVSPKLFW